jgi:hypothetical protein
MPPWSPEEQSDVWRSYNYAVNRVRVKESYYRDEQREADRLERDLIHARADLEETRRRLSKAEKRVKSLTKDLKIERTAWENAQAKTKLYYDVVRRLTGLQCGHIGKLESQGQLAKRVPESLRRQVESAVERAYYEMRAEDGSVAARNRLDQLRAAALEGKEAEN